MAIAFSKRYYRKWYLFIASITLSLAITNCALFQPKRISYKKLPHVPSIQLPGGRGDNWRYLGTTSNNEIISEINEISIKSLTNSSKKNIFSFEDRKTIINPNNFPYPDNLPHYKYALGTWQMNCKDKTYLLDNTTLFNEAGKQIANFNYKNSSDIKWIKFGKSSIGELQYNYVCLNKNRILGY